MRRTSPTLICIWFFGYILAVAARNPQPIRSAPATNQAHEVALLSSGTPTPTSTPTPAPGLVQDLLTRINTLRVSLGLQGYTVNSALSAAAQDQALWMVSTGMVVHTRPDGSTPAKRALAAGYLESWSCSEIIYMGGIATLDDAWEFWLTSPVHYAELTSARHQEVGIGIASSQRFGQAFVAVFGKFGAPVPGVTPPGSYIVQQGDTLYGIAQHYGLSPEVLAAANHLEVNAVISVGQALVIPQSGTPAPSPTPTARTPTRYVVQPGDTLFQIAQKYGVSLDSLITINGIVNPDRIEIGQVLVIP